MIILLLILLILILILLIIIIIVVFNRRLLLLIIIVIIIIIILLITIILSLTSLPRRAGAKAWAKPMELEGAVGALPNLVMLCAGVPSAGTRPPLPEADR